MFEVNLEKSQVDTNILDLIAGGIAIFILISGLVMLFKGISAFEEK